MRALALAAACALSIFASGCESEKGCTVPDGVDPDWIGLIGCEADYGLLWDERTDSVFSRTRTINWLIDREDDNSVYFIDSIEYSLHYFFASAYLEIDGLTPVGTHADFNILNYRRENRRFVLGKLIRYIDQDLLTIEFSAGDTAGADMIVDAYKRISSEIYNGDELLYRPVSADHEQMLPDIESRIPVIRTEDVFQGQQYQSLNPGDGIGYLRFRTAAELAARAASPTDIVVLDRVPNDISLVSGIITSEFQTPLAHINILSVNRGTPNMASRGAFEDPELRSYEDQLVRLSVTPQDFSLAPASTAEAQAYWDSLRPASELLPQFDLTVDGLQDLAPLGLADSIAIGAKAAAIAELSRVPNLSIPLPDSPFAIPFAYYDRHLTQNGIDIAITQLLADYAAGSLEPVELEERLFDIRWQIFRAPMDSAALAELVASTTIRWGADRRLRFRSSTNVEDLLEFSGAGLYTSAGATPSEGDGAVENAVKVVWASVWNHQAFVERDFYRVDHSRVRMGVLVHPAFENEQANGVAVTINSFNQARPAYYINSQVGEVSVTNPTGQAVPEQILFYTWYEEPEYEVITRSSLLADREDWPGGASVMTDSELQQLADYLGAIHQHFKSLYPPSTNFAMDVEFKLDVDRQLVIKQARPLRRR